MKDTIIHLLTQHLKPDFLNVRDDSLSHASHNEAAKSGGTHFTIMIVAEDFSGKTMIQRHRMVYKILDAQLKGRLHALAITALSPIEYKS